MHFEDLEGHDSAVNSSEGCEHPGSTLGLFITIFKIPYVRRIKKTQKRILPPCEGGVQSYGCVRSVLKVKYDGIARSALSAEGHPSECTDVRLVIQAW